MDFSCTSMGKSKENKRNNRSSNNNMQDRRLGLGADLIMNLHVPKWLRLITPYFTADLLQSGYASTLLLLLTITKV